MVKKLSVLVLGKLPPPFMGPSLATQIILNSTLNKNFRLIHINTKTYESLDELGQWTIRKFFRNISIYSNLLYHCLFKRPALVLIPISQTTSGFVKDSIFIWIAKITGRKILLQLRGSNFKNWFDETEGFERKYITSSIKAAHGVIVLGNNLQYIFQEFFSPDKIYVSPNGGDYLFPHVKTKSSGIKLLYLANLQSSKGIEDVLEAVRILLERNENNFHLDVVGEWRSIDTRKYCLYTVKKNHLPVSFFPADAGEKKFMYLATADIFVFTPRAPEGHPWVVVEAMAASLPIVSTNRGAIIESVKEGVNGFIVGIQKPNEIADKLQLLINDVDLRNKMGTEGRRMYEENFTEAKMVERLTKIFYEVIKK